MKILVVGDVTGRSGREALAKHLPDLRREYTLDAVIVNADNASHLSGVTPGVAKELYALGADLLLGGDHIWDQREMLPHLNREPWVLRGINYPEHTPGKGWHVVTTAKGKTLLVIHAMGRVFTGKLVDDPFAAIDKLLQRYTLKQNVDAILVDFHAEATSEKNGLGFYLDGRVSCVVGTHTHIPTNDARVLPKGTGFITDLGMTGDYNSIIGAEMSGPVNYFRTGLRGERYQPTEGEGTLCGAVIDINDDTGLAVSVTPVKRGGAIG